MLIEEKEIMMMEEQERPIKQMPQMSVYLIYMLFILLSSKIWGSFQWLWVVYIICFLMLSELMPKSPSLFRWAIQNNNNLLVKDD